VFLLRFTKTQNVASLHGWGIAVLFCFFCWALLGGNIRWAIGLCWLCFCCALLRRKMLRLYMKDVLNFIYLKMFSVLFISVAHFDGLFWMYFLMRVSSSVFSMMRS